MSERQVSFDEALIAQQLKWFNRGDASSPVHQLNDLQVQIGIVASLARCIDEDALDEWIQHCAQQHTVMPILDPTAYLYGSENLDDWERISHALRIFRRVAVRLTELGIARMGRQSP